jgi:hypothetical protein
MKCNFKAQMSFEPTAFRAEAGRTRVFGGKERQSGKSQKLIQKVKKNRAGKNSTFLVSSISFQDIFFQSFFCIFLNETESSLQA